MEKLFTKKNSKDHSFQFAARPMPGHFKLGAAMALVLVFSIVFAYAQAPSIHYPSTSETYTPGRTIAPLTPTASGVAAFGYSSSPELVGSGLKQPYGVAADAAGNVYVADTYNNEVKKVDPVTGHAEILGSGFNLPYDVVLDAAGNIYVADYGNNAVKKIPAGGGATVTVGSGFNKPTGLTFDASGNLYVADGGNNVIKIIHAGTGAITTLSAGFKSPWGVAIDSAGNIYVTDTGNNEVKKIPVDGGPPVELYSSFTSPRGIVIDKLGNIYVATNHGGFVITPGAAYPVGSVPADYGLAVDDQNNVFWTVPTQNLVYEYAVNSNNSEYNQVASGFGTLTGVAVDAQDNVFVADGALQEMPAGYEKPVNVFLSSPDEQYLFATGVAVTPSDNLYYTYSSTDALELTPYPGGYLSFIGYSFNQPVGIAVDKKNNVYVADSKNNAIKKVNYGRVYSQTTTIGSGFNQPTGVAVDSSSNVYVADYANNAVKEIVGGTGTPVTLGSGFNQPYGIAVDNQGNVIVADAGDGTIKTMPSTGGTPVTIASGFSKPEGVAVDVEGDIYVADAGTVTLTKIKPTGGFHISPNLPTGLSFDQNTGVISGKPTVNSLPTYYTITAYNTSGPVETYVLIAVSAKADLSALQVSGYKLSPYFSPVVTSYTDTVSGTKQSITVTPTAADSLATITVNGTAVASGSASPAIILGEGSTPINIVVTSANGLITKTYTITVFKPFTNNANLSEMHPTAGTMSPVFTPNTTSYTDDVPYTNTSIMILPVTQDSLATIKINGQAVASGSLSPAITLAEGSNTITTAVTAPDGVTTKTYTLTVMRGFSSDANLSEMHPDMGSISPAFSPTVTSYTGGVLNTTSSFTIAVAAQDSLATIKVDGVPVASGTESQSIALAYGDNTIHIVVTAPNGINTQTYTLVIDRHGPVVDGAADAYRPVGVEVTSDKALLADDGLLVHQAVTPNGDGINDVLQIDNISQYPDNRLTIMNRNGQMIFETKGYDNSSKVFDGHSNKNGQMQLPGTYFYQLDYTVSGITKHKTGFLVLKY